MTQGTGEIIEHVEGEVEEHLRKGGGEGRGKEEEKEEEEEEKEE